MGGGPSGGDDTNVTNKALSKAKANRDRKEMAQSGVQDPLDFTRLKENLQARELEKKAEKGQINVPVPTLGSVAINTIGSLAMQQQAKELRRGGEMVTDDKGEYKGVVGTNFLGGRVYSGDPSFDPMSRGATGGDDSSPTTQRADVTPEVTPEITPEMVPNDETITTRYARRRTKRSGQAGTLMEGYGALTRTAGSRSIT
jgi:hypothetical protein